MYYMSLTAQYPHLCENRKLFTGHESQNNFYCASEDIIQIFHLCFILRFVREII